MTGTLVVTARGVVTGAVPRRNSKGFLYVVIRGKRRLLHRLVAESFVANPRGLPFVRFRDGDRSNCAAKNLRWCSGAEIARKPRSGGKLTAEKAAAIRCAIKYGMKASTVARLEGVSRSLVSHIVAGRRWAQ